MSLPAPHDPRQASIAHLEIVENVIQTIHETFPGAANLDCHLQMRDILTRVKNTLHHPILFAAHIIVYLVKAVRFSRRWAKLVKNIATSNPLLSSPSPSSSSVLSPHHSVLSSLSPSPASSLKTQNSRLQTQDSRLQTQDSRLQTQDSLLSTPSDPSIPSISSILSIPSTPCASSHSSSFILPPSSFHHSLETRLRIQAFAQALQHERRLAQKLPLSVPKPDLTPILTVPRHHSVLSSQSSVLGTQPSLLSPHSSALSPFPHSPLFPSESLWASKVQNLQLRILTNITRALDYISVAYLRQYDFPISSIPSIFPDLKAQDSSLKTQTSSPLTPHPSALSPQHSALSFHPPSSNLQLPGPSLAPPP